ncbi:MAG: hypothetical protein HYY85_05915 [Deltaproteobacteria bacterium]|nr:hypothetical protein [Deltaproteobacteria bacterium]
MGTRQDIWRFYEGAACGAMTVAPRTRRPGAGAGLAFVICALGLLLAGPAWGQTWVFRDTDGRGGEIGGVVSVVAAPGLTPQVKGTSGNTATIYLTGSGTTGSDGSVGALLSRIGVTCSTLLFVVATPHYASGDARFAMIGGRDRFGFTVWVGLSNGLGLDGAGFDFKAGCLGSVGGM